MSKLATAERVSKDASDNFVYARSLLAYVYASQAVTGELLEIGTGSGYGVETLAQSATKYTTVDKYQPIREITPQNTTFVEATVPPLPFEDESFDSALSFQVIEHIKDDKAFVREVSRVLRPGGKFILSTPNAPASLTRNPWHVREYTAEELDALVGEYFEIESRCGVFGNDKVMEYYTKNRDSVKAITRYDVLNLQYRLPRWMLQIPYDIANRLNRKRLLNKNRELTTSIKMDDYSVAPLDNGGDVAFDLLYILRKK
ncbi:MAG: class I SAM-dependent methyltransferase [Rikenellaceae bacterium]